MSRKHERDAVSGDEAACVASPPIAWHAATLLCGDEKPSEYCFQRALGLPELCSKPPCLVLCPSWPKKEVRRWILRLLEAPSSWRTIVLLGSKTRNAFGYELPFFSYEGSSLNSDVTLVCLPGPGDRAWRDARLVQRARQILREAVPSLPWGSRHDPLTAFSFSLRCAVECMFWAWAIPVDLREKAQWTEDDFMVALDAVEEHGIDRVRGEYIARVGGKGAAA